MIPLLALAVVAAEPAAGAKPSDAPSPEMEKLLEDCSAHKFETTIDVMIDGKPKKSKVKLCGKQGQTDAQWIGTLKSAAEQTAANDRMPGSVRAQIITALTNEIARLSGGASSRPALTTVAPIPAPALTPPAPTSRGPLPSASSLGYSTYQPLPPPPPAPVISATTTRAPKLMPALPMPKMKLTCFNPASIGGEGPCTSFDRDTMVVVRAGENLPAGTSLRFVRSGETRADVDLAQLARGKFERIPLPPEVCKHVVGGTLEIRIVRTAPGAPADSQVVGSEGPFDLRC